MPWHRYFHLNALCILHGRYSRDEQCSKKMEVLFLGEMKTHY
jgi:hypothetical protein